MVRLCSIVCLEALYSLRMACDQNCVRQENFLAIVLDEQGREKQDSKEGSGSVSLSWI